jgi:hypothetical protein
MIQYFRYVQYERVEAYHQLGWYVVADLGAPHNEHSCLMAWPCKCECVEPTTERERK